ncbi:hypothetical protein RUND412_000668 [Rhizina undulata]
MVKIMTQLLSRRLITRTAIFLAVIFVLIVFTSILDLTSKIEAVTGKWSYRGGSPSNRIVLTATKKDDLSWVRENLGDWEPVMYRVDDKNAEYTVPINKGRESMVYLTYIIDNYDNLPDVTIFSYSDRYQWHNDDPIYDQVPIIRNLGLENILLKGYVNLRCTWIIGCPDEIKPLAAMANESDRKPLESKFGVAFTQLFPNVTVPDTVAVSWCAQFAVTREKIRERSRSDYIRYREWLIFTPLDDDDSGRIMEYSWHMIFGMPAVHCPNVQTCYCETFGLCNLTCSAMNCEGRYVLPLYSSMPKGWPDNGWWE